MPESASVSSRALNRLFRPHTQQQNVRNLAFAIHKLKKTWHVFNKSGNPCDALLGHNESSSMRRSVIRLSFASIADMLQEEFTNKG